MCNVNIDHSEVQLCSLRSRCVAFFMLICIDARGGSWACGAVCSTSTTSALSLYGLELKHGRK